MNSLVLPLSRGYNRAMIVAIEKIVSGGEGMGRIDGKVVFVPLSLPGEVHRVRPVQDKKGFLRAESVEILEQGEMRFPRREPFCPLYGLCGGCNLQHLAYGDQLEAKREIALDGLIRLGGFSERAGNPPPISLSPEKGYRNRAQFHRRGDNLGFLGRGSHDLVPLRTCPLLAGGINRFLEHHSLGDLPSRDRFTLFGMEEQCWTEGDGKDITLTLREREISFRAELFFQSNLTLFETLLGDVLDWGGEGETFMDLYSGVGVFAAFLEGKFARGVAVESSRGALAFARKNLIKTEFFEEPVERWASRNRKDAPDFIVVDPPRTGLSRSARETLLKLGSPRLAYVSCDPVTQARDLKELAGGGYRLADYRLYDFYPQTAHLESVAFLERSL